MSTTVSIELIHTTCPNCSIVYGIPKALYDQRKLDAKDGTVWCPNGHTWHYSGTSHAKELAEAQRQARVEKKRRERDYAYAIRQRDRADANFRSLRTTKGHVTRLKNRAAEGRCQWCDVVIADMEQHVATTHPERVNDQAEDGA